MNPNYYMSPLAVCVAMMIANPVKAATPIHLNQVDLNTIKNTFQMNTTGNFTAVTKGNSLSFIKEHTDSNKVTHARFQQYYAGFKVFGGYAIVHGKKAAHTSLLANNNASMNGVVYQNLEKDLGAIPTDFVAHAQKVLNDFTAKHLDVAQSDATVEPMIYLDAQHKAHWVYKVGVTVTHKNTIPSRPSAILDANTYQPLVSWNDMKTAKSSVKMIGYGGNERAGQFSYSMSLSSVPSLVGDTNITYLPLLDVTRDDAKKMCFMETKDVKVVDMKHQYSSRNRPMQFNCKTVDDTTGAYWSGYKADGYDEINGAYSPSNDALYSGYVIKHMYHDWYDVEALTNSDGTPMQLVLRVHYGNSYENAFWDGRQMTFGDGEDMMYPLVSLGVGAHEISHGFTEQHSGLEYFSQSGGMNESFSDMAAQAAEFYSVGVSSWKIGAEIMKEDSGYEALRFMDLPSKDGSSIDRADEYNENLDVHYSSGVYNHLFYILANQSGWDSRKAFDVMVKANMDYWTAYTTFDEGACGMLSAADDLGYDKDAVLSALEEVAIDTTNCSTAKK